MRRSSLYRTLPTGRRIATYGLPRRPWQDLYHLLMTMSWPRLFMTYGSVFALFNLVFAALYQLQAGDVANLHPTGYWGRFFFSVETLATVGYGDMHPQTVYAHVIASVEIFFGLMAVALVTGMMFARFSRPTARILFARRAVVRQFDGRSTLMLRAANERQNVIMEAMAQLRLIRDELTVEGSRIRRIYDLPLRRNEQPMFIFGWTLLHVIDEASPLYGATAASFVDSKAYLLLTIGGTDETTGQTLMSRQEYVPTAVHWNHGFVDFFTSGDDGIDRFDYSRFHDVAPLDAPEQQLDISQPPVSRATSG